MPSWLFSYVTTEGRHRISSVLDPQWFRNTGLAWLQVVKRSASDGAEDRLSCRLQCWLKSECARYGIWSPIEFELVHRALGDGSKTIRPFQQAGQRLPVGRRFF